mgnify:CR=1 FL=1
MKIIDVSNIERIDNQSFRRVILLSNGETIQNGFKIRKLELRHYTNMVQNESSTHSIITAYLETDEHSIEALYDEGDLGDNALDKSTELLTNNLGLSGLILRLIISLENTLKIQNDQ